MLVNISNPLQKVLKHHRRFLASFINAAIFPRTLCTYVGSWNTRDKRGTREKPDIVTEQRVR